MRSEQALELEQHVTQRNQRIDRLLNALSRVTTLKEELAFDATTELEELDRVLRERADARAGEAEILITRRADLNDALARADDESELLHPQRDVHVYQDRPEPAPLPASASTETAPDRAAAPPEGEPGREEPEAEAETEAETGEPVSR